MENVQYFQKSGFFHLASLGMCLVAHYTCKTMFQWHTTAKRIRKSGSKRKPARNRKVKVTTDNASDENSVGGLEEGTSSVSVLIW
jgi:hypothetical protein